MPFTDLIPVETGGGTTWLRPYETKDFTVVWLILMFGQFLGEKAKRGVLGIYILVYADDVLVVIHNPQRTMYALSTKNP